MNDENIQQPIANLFTSHYPTSKFEFKTVSGISVFKSTFDKEKQFVDFIIKANSLTNIKTNTKYLPEVKRLLSINKMKRNDLKIIEHFFRLMVTNDNFEKIFTIENRLSNTDMFTFRKEGDTSAFTLPLVASSNVGSYFITKFRKSYYRYFFENNFKITRDGTILMVPIIRFFQNQKNEHVFAFNIYNQTIHRIREEAFYFDDFFENSEIFDPAYHGDVFVNEYIDHYVIKTLDDNDDIRKELVLYPLDRLSDKVDLLSMYMI